MAFEFSRPLAANLANAAKAHAQPASAVMRSDANPAHRPDPIDDRIRCTDCCQLSMSGVCRAAGPKRRPVVANRGYQPVRDLPRRCEGFTPYGDDPDPRRGHERWPGLAQFLSPDPASGSNATPPGVQGGIPLEIHR